MFSTYTLNKHGDNIQPWRTPFPVWNQSIVPCPVLTLASWPAYRFLRRQVRWSGIPISWRSLSFCPFFSSCFTLYLFIFIVVKYAALCLVTQSCPTLCDPMDCSPPSSSVHGILQARILKLVAMPSSRGSSQPRNQTQISCIAGRFFTIWVITEAQQYQEPVFLSFYILTFSFFNIYLFDCTKSELQHTSSFSYNTWDL